MHASAAECECGPCSLGRPPLLGPMMGPGGGGLPPSLPLSPVPPAPVPCVTNIGRARQVRPAEAFEASRAATQDALWPCTCN